MVFLLQHPKLTRRDGFNLLFMSPKGKMKKYVETMSSQSSLQGISLQESKLTTKIESAAAGKDVLDHWRFPRIGQMKTLQSCYQRHSVTQYLHYVTFNILSILRLQDSMFFHLECKTSGLGMKNRKRRSKAKNSYRFTFLRKF